MVINDPCDDSRDFSPMTYDIAHIPIVFDYIEPMNVVNVPIVIVVNAITGDLSRVCIDVAGQIWVIQVDSCVNYCDKYIRAARGNGPGFLSVNICARCGNKSINRVSPVQQTPLPL